MASISLCMIVRDEEAVLGRCLESVAPAVDEIIVIDTGSVDGTKAVAAAYTDRIFDFAWVDDFAAARNASFAKATGDYILWLDADDVLLPEDLDALLCLKNRLDQSPADVVMMRYNTGFDSRGNPTFFFDRERLVRRAARPVWYGRVHEYIQCPGTRITVNIAVTHRSIKTAYTTRNLRIYEKMAAAGESFTPRDRFYYGRELYYHRQYDRAVQELQAFLAPGDGWLPDQLEACKFLSAALHVQGDRKGAFAALCRSFALGAPRADLVCGCGDLLLEQGDYPAAICWYKWALELPQDLHGGFVNTDDTGYLPYLRLCVCYDRMGDHAAAARCNAQAAAYRPDDAAVQQNAAYFAALQHAADLPSIGEDKEQNR